MTAAVGIASCLQVGGGGGGGDPSAFAQALGCLAQLLVLALLSIVSFLILRYRKRMKHAGKEKPDFTSIRSTGKTIVNAAPDDDDDDQFGSVN